MIGEIIAIGDELTSGRILNSTSQFAAHHLFAMGHEIVAMSTIGDSFELIGAALRKAQARADFVIVTGGLGPTSDDLTNEAVASALGRPATFYPEILEQITSYLSNGKGPEKKIKGLKLDKLAWLPAGAEVLKPEASMAGYLLVHDHKPIFFLPGVPHEMRELLVDCVIPRLGEWKAEDVRHVRQRVYRIFGLMESEVNKRLKGLESDNSLIRIGYYPVFPEVHLNLTALGTHPEETDSLFELFEQRVMEAVGEYIFGHDQQTLAASVGALLGEQGKSLAAAESCTGGLLSHMITTVAGSSDYFLGGVTAYSNHLKTKVLGVPSAIIDQHGAVSPETARAMAEGICRVSGADLGISITGIAGPSGGSEEKPVGTVCFGLATKDGLEDHTFVFSGKREQVQILSAYTGLDLIRRKLLEEKP